jgi:hypothetical protein
VYKFFVFAPRDEKVIRSIIDAASDAGTGTIGKYKKCAFIQEGRGSWIADDDANPALGKVGKIEYVDEVKIEMECPDEVIQKVVEAVKKVHPYEEVVIDVFKMEIFE